MRRYSQGEVVEVVFPFQEKDSGCKQRPALVLADRGATFVVAKITSQKKGRPWDVPIPKQGQNGLSIDSVVQVDSVRCLSKESLCSVIPRGAINPLQLSLVLDKLKEYKASLRT